MPSVRVATRWASQRVFGTGALLALGIALASAQPDLPVVGPSSGVDELASLNAQILKDPTNAELSLRYASMAEARGAWRLALAAYERVLINDPHNVEALAGLQRVRLRLAPNRTQYTAEIGAVYESNPRYLPNRVKGEGQAEAAFGLRDERDIDGTRWRTTVASLGVLHQHETDLNYAYLGATTGPVLNLLPGATWHPAIGAAAAFFDERFYYGEANANVLIEDYYGGLYSRLGLRVGYREYQNFFVSHQGLYADAIARFALPVGSRDLLIVAPWLRLSNINGFILAPTLLFSEVEPGTYLEGGGRLELYHALTDWLSLGAGFAGLERAYQTEVVPFSLAKRRDMLVIPSASLIFSNLFAARTDLRVDYRYICDRSNDPTQSFTDHVITTSLARRF